MKQIAQLRHIRQLRAERAMQELGLSKHALKKANKFLKQCEEKYREYCEWRLKEDERLFLEIKEKLLPVKKVDEMKAKMLQLKEEEEKLDKEKNEAGDKVKEAEKYVEQCQANYGKAVSELEKFKDIHKKALDQQVADFEYKEEQEQEEFITSNIAL